ncbi:MAG: hypothetical protein AVDCRST_MAG15-2935, partial [uncultured Rubellimicrobium sp.]
GGARYVGAGQGMSMRRPGDGLGGRGRPERHL